MTSNHPLHYHAISPINIEHFSSVFAFRSTPHPDSTVGNRVIEFKNFAENTHFSPHKYHIENRSSLVCHFVTVSLWLSLIGMENWLTVLNKNPHNEHQMQRLQFLTLLTFLPFAQHLKRVDFSFNTHYEPEFKWFDKSLLDAVKSDEEHAHNFFRLLALCHTVMPEYKDGRYVTTPFGMEITRRFEYSCSSLHSIADWNIRRRVQMNRH